MVPLEQTETGSEQGLCNHYWRQKCGKRQQINKRERRIGRLEKVRRNKEKTGKQGWKK